MSEGLCIGNDRPPLLEVRGLRAGYQKAEVVRSVDFTVAAGEVVTILGPNGAGKTSTLLAVMGLLPRMGGEVRWWGSPKRVRPHELARRGVGFVAERSVFQGLTTLANLRLGRGDPERAIEFFPELRRLLHRRAGLLSGGEQQMLTMGRALAAGPELLLVDEVSAGLAPLIVTRLYEATREAAARGVGIVLVEQQVRRALEVADRGYVLSRGQITLSGSAAELRRKLADGSGYLTGTTAIA